MDDNNVSINGNHKEIFQKLLLSDFIITESFCDNYMIKKQNNNDDTSSFNAFNLTSNEEESIFGIKINPKLTFNSHIKTLCAKAGIVAHFKGYLTILIKIKKTLHRSMFKSQSNYCPLVWMFFGQDNLVIR